MEFNSYGERPEGVWKARASEKLGMMRDRDRVALQYNEKLK